MFQELVVRGVVDELLFLVEKPAVCKKCRQEFLQLINSYRGKIIEYASPELESSIYFDVVNLAKSWNISAEKIYALISKDGKASDTPIIVEQIFRLVIGEELPLTLEQRLNYQPIELWASKIMDRTNNTLISIIQEWEDMFFLKNEKKLQEWEAFKEEADNDFNNWLKHELHVSSYRLSDRDISKNNKELNNEIQGVIRKAFEDKLLEYENKFIKRKLKIT